MPQTRTLPEDVVRSLRLFPAGSNGEFNLPPALSLVVERGEACRLWDTSGREFLDFSMGWGSALPGHGHAGITDRVQRQAPLGANFAHVNRNALDLAEEIVRVSPACECLRFCASGTEATMYCQRLARAHTGRMVILKFEGAYHGANEIGVTSLFPSGSTPLPQPEPSSAGIAEFVNDFVLVAPYNDLAATRAIVEANRARLAGIIVEPLHRCIPPEPGFLEGLRDVCDEAGALLIFDEVVTGFRLAYGGAQAYYGVIPDLVAYGKALGGGYPIGAFGGRGDIMELVREDRLGEPAYVWTASTLGGNPISTAAALAALEAYGAPGVYEQLHELGKGFRAGLARALTDAGHEGVVLGDGPLAQVSFAGGPIRQSRDTQRADTAKGRALMLGLFERGIFLNPMGTKLYLSMAHTEGACDEFLVRFADTLQGL